MDALEVVVEIAWGKTLNSLYYGFNIVQTMKRHEEAAYTIDLAPQLQQSE